MELKDTIESIHNKFKDKFRAISLVFEQIKHLSILYDDIKIEYNPVLSKKLLFLNLIINDCTSLEEEYNIKIIEPLAEYYGNKLSDEYNQYSENYHTEKFYQIICSENYIAKINSIIDQLNNYLNVLITLYIDYCKIKNNKKRTNAKKSQKGKKSQQEEHIDDTEDDIESQDDYFNNFLNDNFIDPVNQIISRIKHQINSAKNIKIEVQQKKINYEQCDCGTNMSTNTLTSELKCINCGLIVTLYGIDFGDYQLNYDNNKNKNGSYDPNRHYKFWMDRIQGKEKKNIDKKIKNKITNSVERNNYKINNVHDMRRILRITHLTNYNDHSSLLIKECFNIAPPQLSEKMLINVGIKFNRIMYLLNLITGGSGNRPYYPYFIYKIFEDEIDTFAEKKYYIQDDLKKLEILKDNFIHLQSDETVIKHDKLFYQMIELEKENFDESDQLLGKFKPTIRKEEI
jgi:hypothetical protein